MPKHPGIVRGSDCREKPRGAAWGPTAAEEDGDLLTKSFLRSELRRMVHDTTLAEMRVLGEQIQRSCKDEIERGSELIREDLKRHLAASRDSRSSNSEDDSLGQVAIAQTWSRVPHRHHTVDHVGHSRLSDKEENHHHHHDNSTTFGAKSNKQMLSIIPPRASFLDDGSRHKHPHHNHKHSMLLAQNAVLRARSYQELQPGQPPPLITVQQQRPKTPEDAAPQLMLEPPALPGEPEASWSTMKSIWEEGSSPTCQTMAPDASDKLRTTAASSGCESLQDYVPESARNYRGSKMSMMNSDVQRNQNMRLSIGLELARKRNLERDRPWWQFTAPWKLTPAEMLHSTRFDNMISMLILMNAISIGIEADYQARHITEDSPLAFRTFEVFFCCIFTSELSLRIYVNKHRFFWQRDLNILWNYFDLTVVAAQLVQEAIAFMQTGSMIDADQFRVMRVLRILRIVRIFRLVRVLHLISELRTIVSSIMGSVRSLVWTVVLLLLMIYIVGVFFTQSITDHMVGRYQSPTFEEWNEDENKLLYYFGSLGRTILSLWQSISGGTDWDSMANPLIAQISALLGLAFAAYTLFALLALMNVVTGVFVQTALQSAKEEEDSFLTDQIVALFNMAEKDKQTRISLEAVKARLADPDSAKEWKAINVTSEEAKYLFDKLDVEQDGEIFFEEFLGGCLRLKGPSKSLDMLTVMQEARAFRRRWEDASTDLRQLITGQHKDIQFALTRLSRVLDALTTKQSENWDELRGLEQSMQALSGNSGKVKLLESLVENFITAEPDKNLSSVDALAMAEEDV